MARQQQDPPEAVRSVLHYANASVTDDDWRDVLAKGFQPELLARGIDRSAPLMGVRSADEAREILGRFRTTVQEIVELRDVGSPHAMDLARKVSEEAQLTILRLGWDTETECLEPRWETKKNTFSEALNAKLAMALNKTSRRALHRCSECGTFFYDRSRRPARYCSQSCRSRGSARDFRTGVRRRAPKKRARSRRRRRP